ncbi:hypothetical protein, partial [Brevibacillus sp. LEMMJ03]|uniref:hypothetical protein n=1 Tax=Brevibacillus sp. LEMMJ03 TaxID=2595056 RepID=UPI001C8F57E9
RSEIAAKSYYVLTCELTTEEIARLSRRGAELRRTYCKQQRKQIEDLNVRADGHFLYDRGFFSNLSIDAKVWLQNGEFLLQTTPLTSITFENISENVMQLKQCHFLSRVRNLKFGGFDEISAIRTILESTYLSK